MSARWHEQIQRYMTGEAASEEIAALQQALKDDAELRVLYLDYLNLDVALGAAAELAALAENTIGRTTAFPQIPVPSSRRHWRWLAATAACAALVLYLVFSKHRQSPRAQPDIAAALSSSQSAVARLSIDPPSVFPAWSSPTASLLDQPHLSR
jgi:anti-sigma-K factor RskA